MSLVGMASKPLHVRRLQKSLQEFVTNPYKFKSPLVPGEDYELELSSPRISSNHTTYATENSESSRPLYSPSSSEICALPPVPSPGLSIGSKRYVQHTVIECLSCYHRGVLIILGRIRH